MSSVRGGPCRDTKIWGGGLNCCWQWGCMSVKDFLGVSGFCSLRSKITYKPVKTDTFHPMDHQIIARFIKNTRTHTWKNLTFFFWCNVWENGCYISHSQLQIRFRPQYMANRKVRKPRLWKKWKHLTLAETKLIVTLITYQLYA